MVKKRKKIDIKATTSKLFEQIKNEIYETIKTDTGRLKLYGFMLLYGFLLVLYLHDPILWVLMLCTSLKDNDLFSSTLALFLLTFPIVSFNWWLKNHDQIQQFKDTQQQYDENLLANAQLLFKQDEHPASSVSLKQLVTLRHKNYQNKAFARRIDMITSSGLKLANAKLEGVNLVDVKLNHADLRGSNLQEANLFGINLSGADLQEANLKYADLTNAELQEANLKYADLSSADLYDADLSSADLCDADLQGAKLNHARFDNATYNDETKFPEGFNPKGGGMIYVPAE